MTSAGHIRGLDPKTRRWLLALGLALAAHLALLWPASPPPLALAGLPALQIRNLAPPAPPSPPPPLPRRAPDAQPTPAPTRPAPASDGEARPELVPASPSAASAVAALQAPPLLATAIESMGEGSLQYRLEQGGQEGRATLSWQMREGRYQLDLSRELPGRRPNAWHSEGQVQAQGLLPERFALQRDGQDRQAINFRREEGLISYSSSRALHPLPDGVQDRLSWWLQLPAMVAAAPQRLQAGQPLSLEVAALRGPPMHWLFRFEGPDAQGLWVFTREPQGPFDGRLEVWLDPARRFLPVHVRQSVGDEERWDMQLLPDAAQAP